MAIGPACPKHRRLNSCSSSRAGSATPCKRWACRGRSVSERRVPAGPSAVLATRWMGKSVSERRVPAGPSAPRHALLQRQVYPSGESRRAPACRRPPPRAASVSERRVPAGPSVGRRNGRAAWSVSERRVPAGPSARVKGWPLPEVYPSGESRRAPARSPAPPPPSKCIRAASPGGPQLGSGTGYRAKKCIRAASPGGPQPVRGPRLRVRSVSERRVPAGPSRSSFVAVPRKSVSERRVPAGPSWCCAA